VPPWGGIFLLGYPVGAFIERAKTRDNEKANRKAEEVAAAVVALADEVIEKRC